MAWLKEVSTGTRRPVEAEHPVGRGPNCSLCLPHRYVSAQHAILRFNGERWEIRDLSSKNGTYLDGVRLRSGEEHVLRLGSRIAFGKLEQQWDLVDDAPPWPMAVPLDGGEATAIEGELLALPSTDDPRATVYRNTDGTWVLEQQESVSPITNMQVFEVDGRAFRFSCPEPFPKTSLADRSPDIQVRQLKLLFAVSRDEEHVEVSASWGASATDLGARMHNYLLLTLARRRLADAAEGVPETSCGWIYQEDLAHDPSMVPPQLNIDVFRIRRQFAALGIVDAANIIERRPRTRQLRIGVSQLSVVNL